MKLLLSLFAALLLSLPASAQQSYRALEVVAPGTVITTTGTSALFDTRVDRPDYKSGETRMIVVVSAMSGTSPSFTFSLRGAAPGFPSLHTSLCTMAAMTSAGASSCTATAIPQDAIIQWVVSGTTPSATIGVWLIRQ